MEGHVGVWSWFGRCSYSDSGVSPDAGKENKEGNNSNDSEEPRKCVVHWVRLRGGRC